MTESKDVDWEIDAKKKKRNNYTIYKGKKHKKLWIEKDDAFDQRRLS